jgi:hypothetical protein
LGSCPRYDRAERYYASKQHIPKQYVSNHPSVGYSRATKCRPNDHYAKYHHDYSERIEHESEWKWRIYSYGLSRGLAVGR